MLFLSPINLKKDCLIEFAISDYTSIIISITIIVTAGFNPIFKIEACVTSPDVGVAVRDARGKTRDSARRVLELELAWIHPSIENP